MLKHLSLESSCLNLLCTLHFTAENRTKTEEMRTRQQNQKAVPAFLFQQQYIHKLRSIGDRKAPPSFLVSTHSSMSCECMFRVGYIQHGKNNKSVSHLWMLRLAENGTRIRNTIHSLSPAMHQWTPQSNDLYGKCKIFLFKHKIMCFLWFIDFISCRRTSLKSLG